MQSVRTTGRLLNPQFIGLHALDRRLLSVVSFSPAGSAFAPYEQRCVEVGPIERLLAIPVYLVYWVVGISTAISVALAYVNSNHNPTFENIFEFIISDPTAQKFYAARYAIDNSS
jgi:hypothetical protein